MQIPSFILYFLHCRPFCRRFPLPCGGFSVKCGPTSQFALVACAFGARARAEELVRCVSSESFVVPASGLRGARWGPSGTLPWLRSLPSAVRSRGSFPVVPSVPSSRPDDVCARVYFWALGSVPFIHVSVSMPVPYCFDYYVFVM